MWVRVGSILMWVGVWVGLEAWVWVQGSSAQTGRQAGRQWVGGDGMRHLACCPAKASQPHTLAHHPAPITPPIHPQAAPTSLSRMPARLNSRMLRRASREVVNAGKPAPTARLQQAADTRASCCRIGVVGVYECVRQQSARHPPRSSQPVTHRKAKALVS